MALWGQDKKNKPWAACSAIGFALILFLMPGRVIAADNDSEILLDQALREIARRHKVQIIFPPEAVKYLQAPKVSGLGELADVLDATLAGSGLEFSFINRNFVVVKAVTLDGDELSGLLESHNAGLSNDNDGDQFSNDAPQYSGAISGRIVSAATQKPLAGVSVAINELNLQTFTDGDGQYRLRGLPGGAYTVTMSYFGLPEETFPIELNRGESLEVLWEIGSLALDAITVTGVRSAYQNSVNSHRSVNNIASILAGDLNGHYPDDTLAEALRRAPGVSFERDERGGEGEFVSIRGLDAGFNSVRINGQTAPFIGVFDGRRVSLDSFQTDSVSKLVVHKSLLPHQPSVGIGGVVDIITVSPLDAIDREFSLTAEGRYSEFSDKTGYFLRGRYSDRLGRDDNIGVFVSASMRRRLLRTFQFDVIGTFLPSVLPLDSNGAPVERVGDLQGPDPIDLASLDTIEDLRLNIFDDRRDVFMASAGIGWRVSDHTNVNAVATYNQRNIDTTRSTISFEQSDRYTDRNLATGEVIDPDTERFFFFGRNPFLRQRAEVEDQDRHMLAASLDAVTEIGRLKARYGGGVARGRERFPLSTEIDFNILDLDSDALSALPVDPETGARFIRFNLFNPDVPAPELTEAGAVFAANPENAEFRDLRIITREVNDRRHSLFFDIDYDFGAETLQSLQWGFEYASGKRRDVDALIFNDDNIGADGSFGGDGQFSLADTMVIEDGFISLDPIDDPFNGFAGIFQTDRDGVLLFRDRFLDTVIDGSFASDADSSFIKSKESTFTGYVSALINIGHAAQFRGGLRLEGFRGRYRASRVVTIEGEDIDLAFRADPLEAQERSTFEALPRAVVDYRLSDRFLLKASVFESIARPRFSALSAPQEIEIDLEAGTAILELSNVDIPNIRARNYDVSLQYFGVSQSFIELNAYYKTINNYRIAISGASETAPQIVDNGLLVDYLPDELPVDISGVENVFVVTPIEGVSAEAYGLDFSILHQFNENTGILDGVGVRVSGGIQHTSFILDNGRETPRELEFANAPTFAGTASLWYQNHALSAYAIYSYQGRQLNTAERLFPDEYVQPYSALDLRFQYDIGDKLGTAYAFYIAASDVLDNGRRATTHETIGVSASRLDDIEFNGREIRFGVQANF